ncbi:MAG: GIY-YIG nuclease family protein [Chitinophagales bacterium]|nr:GIY-YIG nuclease family protein [Chitinophagales bacterium]
MFELAVMLLYLHFVNKHYYVYILTNPEKTVLYTGVTNDLVRRIQEHKENKGLQKTFAGRYFCYKLVYYESCTNVRQAIEREKEIKGWRRQKKEQLIKSVNPTWQFIDPYELLES